MMNKMLTAKTIVKNKFWIVEEDGQKVATIQSLPTGVAYVKDNMREPFASISMLKSKYNIAFDKPGKAAKRKAVSSDVHGYPCDITPFNPLMDLSKNLPIYTKTEKSKSYFCAGHYLIRFNVGVVHTYCPKLITLDRYEYYGPFITKTDAKAFAKTLKDA
jgi:hypothetical protein